MIDKRPKTPREVAAFSLFSMAEEGAWSDGALHHYLSRAGLDGRDAALAARLTYGTVQNELLLDWYLRRFSSLRLKKIAPRVLACLRMGLYQLILMDKIPAHAAVAETVSLVRHYCHANDRTVSFANAVMRKAAEAVEKNALPRLDCPDKESYYALRYSHPEWLVRLLSEQFGQKLTERICQADNADTPVSVRVNRMKTTLDEAKAELERAGMTVTPHRAFADILLCTGGDAAATEAFREGRITVQDAASALAAFVADPKPGTAVLDCCAAPGGKSFAAAIQMRGEGRIVSCDVQGKKLRRIEEGASRLGIGCIETRQMDARRPAEELLGAMDVVIADAPCSGLGVIRKKPEIRFKPESELSALPGIQLDILRGLAACVKPGGTLLYSTCTLRKYENEDVVAAFLTENNGFKALEMRTLWPDIDDTDGFFLCRLVRST